LFYDEVDQKGGSGSISKPNCKERGTKIKSMSSDWGGRVSRVGFREEILVAGPKMQKTRRASWGGKAKVVKKWGEKKLAPQRRAVPGPARVIAKGGVRKGKTETKNRAELGGG